MFWEFIEDFMLEIDNVNGDKEMIEMDTEDNKGSICWGDEEELEDREKSGMTLRFSGWRDKDVIYCNREQQRQWA